MDNNFDSEKRICRNCAAENEQNAKFCIECGAKLILDECPQCSAPVLQNAKFCSQCGYNLQESHGEKPQAIKEPKEQAPAKKLTKSDIKGSRAYSIVKSSLFLLISALVLLFSFLPILSYEIDETYGLDRDNTIKITFTPIENTIFLFDSIIENDEEDMELDSFYDKYEDALEEIEDIGYKDTLSAKDKKAVAKFAKLTARLALRSDTVSFSPQFLVLALVSILYMAFALSFFGVSLFQFVRTLMKATPNYRLLKSLLCLAPFVIIFTYLASKGDYVSSTMACGTPSLVICLVGILLVLLDAYIIEGNIPSPKKAISLGLCLCLVVACTFLAIGSAFGVEITNGRTAKTTFSAVYFQEYELNDKMLEELSSTTSDDIKEGVNSLNELYTIKDIRNGEADIAIAAVMSMSVYKWLEDSCVAVCAIYYLALLACFFFALVGYEITDSLCNNTKTSKSTWIFTIIGLVFTIAYLITDIVFISMANSIFYRYYLETIIDVQIVAAPIILTTCAVLALGALITSKVLESKKPRIQTEEINSITE